MSAFPKFIRVSAVCILISTAMLLGHGAILYRASFATGADSNYLMPMTWRLAFRSVIWPPTNIPYVPLVGVAALTIFTAFVFFRMPRAASALILFLQSVVAYFVAGSFGFFFLRREFEKYHFSMDAERLGENWFTYESVAIWCVAAFVLAILRIMARTNRAADKPQVSPQTATL